MGAFQALAARHPKEVIHPALLVDTDERVSHATLSLRAGGQVTSLAKSPVQVVDLP